MISFLHWHTEPFLVGGILLFGWIYSLLTGPFRLRLFGFQGVGPAYPRLEGALFYSGLIALYIAVGSPIDAMGENFLFSVHMVQHNLLMYLVAPLLVAGIPGWMADTAFARWPSLERVCRALFSPLLGGVLFTLIFSAWHLPSFYDAALHNKPLHIFEHLTMVFGAFLMWWPILSRSRHIPPKSVWVQCLYVFALMIAQTPIFGILVFSDNVLYPTYFYAPRISWIDISPLEDQVLGGVVMKVANMGISLMVLARAFLLWERRERNAASSAPTPHSINAG